MKLTGVFFICILLIQLTSCRKLTTVDAPSNSITGSSVFNNDGTAASVLTGIYSTMSSGNSFPFATGIRGISVQAGLSADELTLWSGSTNLTFRAQYQNALSNLVYPPYWSNLYFELLTVNSAIEGLTNSANLTPSIKQQLLGESKFMRAFFNFYLVNLYGDIPLPTSSDFKVNTLLDRTNKEDVYKLITSDLLEAANELSTNYLDNALVSPTTERVRPTKWAAKALLARVYLYTGNWKGAEDFSIEVINQSTLYDTVPLNKVFLANSREAIWQLQPVNSGYNTEDARTFVLPVKGPNNSSNPIYLTASLSNSFELNDNRVKIGNWVNKVTNSGITYYYPYKYKITTVNAPVTEYTMVLRLAEQYLIRAEARAQQGNIAGAIVDLNVIRARAGLPNYSGANTVSAILATILHERQVELFTEWGHRWFDLKRTGNIDNTMAIVTPQKGGTWKTNWQLYPIPNQDIMRDPNLNQNPGY